MRTINARPNPKYFGIERGVTYYNFSSDQFSAFHGIVIPGTVRDSMYVLDGLLEQQTCLQPTEIITDTAGYTDVVFGLFWLLGFQFSPRLADTFTPRSINRLYPLTLICGSRQPPFQLVYAFLLVTADLYSHSETYADFFDDSTSFMIDSACSNTVCLMNV